MTWHVSTTVCSMPPVLDLPSESPPTYDSEHIVGQHDYMFPTNLGHHDTLGGRYNTASFPYLNPGSEDSGYCQQQYTTSVQSHHQTYRDNNSFVWIGTNNFYPPSSYDQRFSEDSYNSERQNHRRQFCEDRNEKSSSRKRRAPTVAQRRAANIRERRRMYNLNEAFDCLRQRIPTFAYEKRLSRIETLRLAISYISFMARIVNGEDPSTLRVSTYESPMCTSTTMTQPILRNADAVTASQSCDNEDYDEDRNENVDEEEFTSDADDDTVDNDRFTVSGQGHLVSASDRNSTNIISE